jgi:hypothetical protein
LFCKRGPAAAGILKGGCSTLRKILRSRLPERLAHRIPPAVIEIGVGVLAALIFLGIRIALIPFAGDRAP